MTGGRRESLVAAAIFGVLMISELAAAVPMTDQARARIQASGVVGPQVIEAFETADRVRVVIAFALPDASARSATEPLSMAALQDAIASARAALLDHLGPEELEIHYAFHTVNAVAATISSAGVLALLDNPMLRRIDLDAGGGVGIDDPLPLVHLDALHQMGLTGEGVTVAVIDSGVATHHPDLATDLVAQRCFCSSSSGVGGCCPNGASTQEGPGSAEDDNGHGTNVAGIITSDGAIAPLGGAPDARIVAIKVTDANGRFCCASDLVAALDWVITERSDVSLVNFSLGSDQLFAGDCDTATAWTMALAAPIGTLRARGALTFAASLNGGSGTGMSAPACVKNAISVGAVYNADIGSYTSETAKCTNRTTHADQVTCFSNSDGGTDLFAPGCPTTSTGLGDGTSEFCGTSQASPLTAACAACLLQAEPSVSPDQLERALKTSPTHVTAPQNGRSFPRLDCAAALASLPVPTAPPGPCAGDCNGDGVVTVNELVIMVDVALGGLSDADCLPGDTDADGRITVDELVAAVHASLIGC